MTGKRTLRRKAAPLGAHLWRFPRFVQRRDSTRFLQSINAFVILTILIAVATTLIAPSIDMPDTVLHEHQVASHSAGGHGSNTLVNLGISTPLEARRNEGASRSSEILHSPNCEYKQSSVVLRC